MLFSSTVFLFLFLPFVLLIYYAATSQLRNTILLLASLFFYAWGEVYYVFLMLFTVALNYLGGLLIDQYRQKRAQAFIFLSLTVVLNLALLLYFKYFNFVVGILQSVGLENSLSNASIHLPIGISFYTFHNISYLVDLYRNEVKVQKNLFDLALYIAFFPQLVAGPIIRYHDIDQQIFMRAISWEKFYVGITRFTRGLAKKVLIANTVAIVTDDVFSLPAQDIPTPMAWLGIVCYSLQLYFDFSGYSDMAIGLGKMFGFDILENFNYPYVSKSIQEFWRRWHISLSSWFRDYVYIPLGGSKVSLFKTYRNILIVFFLTGLWHGASWNFIAWGLFYGFLLIAERLGLSMYLKKSPSFVQHAYALFFIIIGWVFFRAADLAYAFQYLQALFGFHSGENYHSLTYVDTFTSTITILGIVFATPLRPWLKSTLSFQNNDSPKSQALNIAEHVFTYLATVSMFFLSVMQLAKSSYNPFIYFRF